MINLNPFSSLSKRNEDFPCQDFLTKDFINRVVDFTIMVSGWLTHKDQPTAGILDYLLLGIPFLSCALAYSLHELSEKADRYSYSGFLRVCIDLAFVLSVAIHCVVALAKAVMAVGITIAFFPILILTHIACGIYAYTSKDYVSKLYGKDEAGILMTLNAFLIREGISNNSFYINFEKEMEQGDGKEHLMARGYGSQKKFIIEPTEENLIRGKEQNKRLTRLFELNIGMVHANAHSKNWQGTKFYNAVSRNGIPHQPVENRADQACACQDNNRRHPSPIVEDYFVIEPGQPNRNIRRVAA